MIAMAKVLQSIQCNSTTTTPLKVVEDRLHKVVVNELGVHSLIIDHVYPRDAGLYTCLASNAAGQDQFRVALNVEGGYEYNQQQKYQMP